MSAAGPTPVELAARLLVDMEGPFHVENKAAADAMASAHAALTGRGGKGAPQPVDFAHAVTLLRQVVELTAAPLEGAPGTERQRLAHVAQVTLHLLGQAGRPPAADCMAPAKSQAAGDLGDILDEMSCALRPLLAVARYVSAAHCVLEGVRSAAAWDKALAKRMSSIHPHWREPDADGDTLMALSELLMHGESVMFHAMQRADAVRRGGKQ